MPNVYRIRVGLSGSPVVGPGLMTFYSSTAPDGLPAATKTFVTALADRMPSGISFDVPSTGDVIDMASSNLVNGWSATGGGTVASGNTTGYALGAGGIVAWKTGVVANGYHIQGRTFVVPLAHGCFDSSGHLDDTTVNRLNAAGAAFISALGGGLCVYSRHLPARQGAHGLLPERQGGTAAIGTAITLRTPTALRSRRV